MDAQLLQKNKCRYGYLDTLRGITLISMIAFHLVWDLVYLAGFDWKWFESDGAYLWQQSICWTFILLSGFCFSLGGRKLRRGLLVLGMGILTSLVTRAAAYESRVTFGVLTFLGAAMLLLIFPDRLLRRIPALWGAFVSFFCFLFTKGINQGFLGFYYPGSGKIQAMEIVRLPDWLYEQGPVFTFLGFTQRGFYSSDYFSLFPWIFLFLTGYFLYQAAFERNLLRRLALRIPKLPFETIGRHSLLIYLLHQPVIYGALKLLGVI